MLAVENPPDSESTTFLSTRSRQRKVATVAHMMRVICVYDGAGNVIETHEHTGDFKEP